MALNLDQIRTVAQRAAASHGLDVVEVEYRAGARPRVLCIYIEKNAEERAKLAASGGAVDERLAGITHEDCTAFSRDFGTLLDVEDLVPGSEYTLEVSSPGLDRRLRSADDFARFRGSLVKVQTYEPVEGNRHWRGRLTAADSSAITLDIEALKQNSKGRKAAAKAAQGTVAITLANIEKAQLIPEF